MLAAVAAFNKRGGVGTTHAKMQADVCDTHGDANGEVACARQMVDDGVVATLDDLTYNNPAGVVDILQGAGIPRIGIGGTDVSEFSSSVSYPVSAGIIATYIGTAVGFKQDGNTKICLVRTDAPTGATFRGFLTPMFTAVGINISCDVAVATGATDYAPYVAQVQQENPDAVLISHSDSVTTQLIGAMAQLNAKIPLGGAPGSFTLDTLRKYKDLMKGTVLADSFPYPSQVNVKNFPGLKQYFADMKASGKSSLSAGEAEGCVHCRLDRHARLRERDQVARLVHSRDRDRSPQERQGRRPPGADPAVDTVDARLQRVQVELEPLRVRLSVQRQGRGHRQATGRRHPVRQVTAG